MKKELDLIVNKLVDNLSTDLPIDKVVSETVDKIEKLYKPTVEALNEANIKITSQADEIKKIKNIIDDLRASMQAKQESLNKVDA